MKKKLVIIIIMFILLFQLSVYADDEYCTNLNHDIEFVGENENSFYKLIDGNIRTIYYLNVADEENSIGFKNNSDSKITKVYIKWAIKPSNYLIEKSSDGNIYSEICKITTDFLSDLNRVTILPGEYLRIFIDDTSTDRFAIDEIEVYDDSVLPLPPSVQNWDSELEKTDMMIFSAHADDEWVFFGGMIPLYSIEEKKDTIVVYMSTNKYYRRAEALASLWSANLTSYPIFAPFRDKYSESLEETMQLWGERETIKYCVRLIREYKPELILTHDFDGEYGHGAHLMTAYAVDKAVLLANDQEYDTKSVEQYGIWETKKLYIHMYEENTIEIDFTIPLSEYGGLTAYEVSERALLDYESQLEYTNLVYVHSQERYSCAEWGLRYTAVGPDTEKVSIFENIPTATPTIEPTTIPTPTATPSPTMVTAQITPSPIVTISDNPLPPQQENNNIILYVVVPAFVLMTLIVLYLIYKKTIKKKE